MKIPTVKNILSIFFLSLIFRYLFMYQISTSPYVKIMSGIILCAYLGISFSHYSRRKRSVYKTPINYSRPELTSSQIIYSYVKIFISMVLFLGLAFSGLDERREYPYIILNFLNATILLSFGEAIRLSLFYFSSEE